MTPDPDEPRLQTTRAHVPADDPRLVADRYRIERVLGRGGGGTVWLAVDEHLGRQVALKKVAGEADAEILVTRGLREARTSAALAHDHVVRVFDAFEHEGYPWIVMEYVPGPSLEQLLEDRVTLTPAQVARIGAQLATALAAAHGRGILHRDVKPANVLLTDDTWEQAKLTDFGIARSHEDSQLTRTGFVSGTAAFFSPELAVGQDPSAASDVWALGATLYAAVEGRRPFPTAANAVAQLHTIAREEPREPLRAGPLTPVLAGMLHADPERRWTAEQAASALRRLADPGPRTEAVAGPSWEDATSVHPVAQDTRRVPVATPPPARQDHRTPRPAPAPRAPRRRASASSILLWVLAIPLIALLAWLVWALVGQQGLLDGDGDGSGDGTNQTATTAITEAEGREVAESLYLGLVRGGPESVADLVGPDVDIAADIGEGLTYVEWSGVTVAPEEDGRATLDVDVTYTYGTTLYEQHETLTLERPEDGGAPIIVERTTTEPTITEQGDNQDGEDSGTGDEAEQTGDAG